MHNGPTSGYIKYWLARLWLQLLGWNVTGELPQDSKFVLIGGLHTSNWDFIIDLPALYVFRLKTVWMGKDALFKWPLGFIMRSMGGLAIDRSSPHGVVEQTAKHLQQASSLVILISAKGTRGKTEYWKSGFYHIAIQANVRIVCGYLDYSTKTASIGYSFIPGDNVKRDMDAVREFFSSARGKNPELEDNIRLREED